MAIGPKEVIESDKKLRKVERVIDVALIVNCSNLPQDTAEGMIKVELKDNLTSIEKEALCERYKKAGWSEVSAITYPDSSEIKFAIVFRYKK